MSRSWLTISMLHQRTHQETNGKLIQRDTWKRFLESPDNGIMFPNMCDLIMILLATPANTLPLERSYTWLEMISVPRRNQIDPDILELLYLLKALNLPVKTSAVKLLPNIL